MESVFLKNKILLWLEKDFFHFGLARSLQEKYSSELYVIADVRNDIKKFLEKQSLVKFQKIWFYNEYISTKILKPDLSYLSQLEEKYGINIWHTAYIDRIFYPKFNKYHKFSYDEILYIIECGARFFLQIIDEIDPDFLLIETIVKHNMYLLYQICKAKGVNVITIEPHHFGNRYILSSDVNKMLDMTKYDRNISSVSRTADELQNYLRKAKPLSYGGIQTPYKITSLDKLKAVINFVIHKDHPYSNQYAYYGRTKFTIITKGAGTLYKLRKMNREYFINNYFRTEINNDSKFVYYPLAVEPERRLLLSAPYYSDQLAVITNISKSLPVGYKLFVKEHPAMNEVGWREMSFYKYIMNLPNVVLIHPSVSNEELIMKSALVITITGTAALEAAFYQKPSIVFVADTGYSLISSIYELKNIEELPKVIRSSLKNEVKVSELNDYVNYVDKNSIEFDLVSFTSELAQRFKFEVGFMNQVNIKESEMTEFLDKYKSEFDTLANEHVTIMKEYKTIL